MLLRNFNKAELIQRKLLLCLWKGRIRGRFYLLIKVVRGIDFLLRIKWENHSPHRDWSSPFGEYSFCFQREVSPWDLVFFKMPAFYPHTWIDSLCYCSIVYWNYFFISIKVIHCLLRVCCIWDMALGAQHTSVNLQS